jgi:hypothetical protein
VLRLLAEQPMHGYQVIQELSARSGGAWNPSAGSVYPTLQMLEDEGRDQAESSGKRVYELTDAAATRPPGARSRNAVPKSQDALRPPRPRAQVIAATRQVAWAGTTAQPMRRRLRGTPQPLPDPLRRRGGGLPGGFRGLSTASQLVWTPIDAADTRSRSVRASASSGCRRSGRPSPSRSRRRPGRRLYAGGGHDVGGRVGTSAPCGARRPEAPDVDARCGPRTSRVDREVASPRRSVR